MASIKRIANVTRWDLITNWKGYRSLAISFTLAYVIGLCIMNWNCRFSTQETFSVLQWGGIMSMSVAMLMTFPCLISSFISDKQKKISYLMLPASMTEKLLSRMFICFILFPIMLLVCFFLGDLIHYLVIIPWMPEGSTNLAFFDFFSHWHSLFPSLVATNSNGETTYMYFDFINVLLLPTTYLFMGGCLFTKRAIIKTWGIGIVVLVLFGMFMDKTGGHLLNSWMNTIGETNAATIARWGGNIIALGMNITFAYVGYKHFVNREIVKNRRFL
ncbi:MAG: hypothetical protein MJZ69_00375 [Bacteroidaceae bacterium]|nr:hypothetical protein [Bacteroidaceae bacterium]